VSGEEGAERSHEATPQKLEEARRKGELVKSQDLSVAASYLGAGLAILLLGPMLASRMADLGGSLLAGADRLSDGTVGAAPLGGAILGETVILTALAVLAPAGLVLVVLLAQRSIVVAPSKLEPKLSRIGLIANARNKFGPNGLFEFAKSTVKMGLYGAILGWFIWRDADKIVAAAALPPRQVGATLTEMLLAFLVPVTLIALSIALLDYAWQHHSHHAKNRMTRQEVMDEFKKSEGDPQLKAQRRRRAQEIAMNTMLADVPDAAVVVVNPTHYAVALKWSPLDPSPPVCVAKGTDEIAARIREAATGAGVPIFSDPPTARALHATVEIGDPIEREHFAAVAVAIRFARDLVQGGGR
jgi:flagellar biosynthetic protein FlhB